MTPVLSASQVSTFGTEKEGGNNEGCERKWAFKYVSKLPDPSGPGAEAGKRIHKFIELWLSKNEWPEGTSAEAKTARAMAKYLPPPSDALRVEEPFIMELDGVQWRGFKDLVYYDGATLVVHDHKSTSSLKWAKTEEDLRHDAQSILYARHAFQEADVVDLSWLYGTRDRTPQVLPVRFNISYDEVASAIPPLTRTGKRILALYEKQPDPNSLDPNLAVCDMYGGCPFKGACSITPVQRIHALQKQYKKAEEKQMGFRDRIKQATTEAPALLAEPTSKAPVAVEQPRVSMREKLQGFGSAINPPVAQSVDTPAQVSTAAAPMAPLFGVTTTEPQVLTPTKRGPGRPKKEILAGVAAAQVMRESSGFTLYVNCAPNAPYTPLSQYLEPVLANINLEHGVSHYGQIDYKSAGILGAALYTLLQTSPPTGALVMDSRTKEGADCLNTLERFASAVVRGF